MSKTIGAVFDGQVLRPDEPIDLKPNTRCKVTIETPVEGASQGDAWKFLEKLIGSVEAPPDWSEEHDHYLYGTPKRSAKE